MVPDEDKISLMISNDSLEDCDIFICKELAAMLDVDLSKLLLIINLDPKSVEFMMQELGIPQTKSHRHNSSWIQEVNLGSQAEHCRISRQTGNFHPSIQSGLDKRLIDGCIDLILQHTASQHAIYPKKIISPTSRQITTFSAPVFESMCLNSDLEMKAISIASDESTSDHGLQIAHESALFVSSGSYYSRERSHATGFQLTNGILGEAFVGYASDYILSITYY